MVIFAVHANVMYKSCGPTKIGHTLCKLCSTGITNAATPNTLSNSQNSIKLYT